MFDRIISDPNICGGEACIKGTRIPVHVILSHLAAGESIDSILRNFPRISNDDIKACLERSGNSECIIMEGAKSVTLP